jgi:hypothetical protein
VGHESRTADCSPYITLGPVYHARTIYSHSIGLKGSFLSRTSSTSSRGRGSPLTRAFAGSKLLPYCFTSLSIPYVTAPYLRRQWSVVLGAGGGRPSTLIQSLSSIALTSLRAEKQQICYPLKEFANQLSIPFSESETSAFNATNIKLLSTQERVLITYSLLHPSTYYLLLWTYSDLRFI